MYHIIGGNGKEYGPVDESTLRQWLKQGRASHNTRARRDGESKWATIGDLLKENSETPEPATPGPKTSEESQAPTTEGATEATGQQTKFGKFRIGKVLDDGFALLLKYPAAAIGGGAFVILLNSALAGIGMIPLVGLPLAIAHKLLLGPICAGSFLYFLRMSRGGTHQIEDLVSGFGRRFIQIMFCWIIQLAAMAVCCIPAIIWTIKLAASFDINTADQPEFLIQAIATLGLYLLPIGLLGPLWIWSIPLVIDRKMDAIDALKLSTRAALAQFIPLNVLTLITSMIAISGVALCCVGVLFTGPLFLTTLVVAYEVTFPPAEPDSSEPKSS